VGLKFGEVSFLCHSMLLHQPLMFEYSDPKELQPGGKHYAKVQYLASFGMPPEFMFVSREERLKSNGSARFNLIEELHFDRVLTDSSYYQRAWCIIEYVIRFLERGPEFGMVGSGSFWQQFLDYTASPEQARQLLNNCNTFSAPKMMQEYATKWSVKKEKGSQRHSQRLCERHLLRVATCFPDICH
jgi:hypothetical protein